METIESYDVTGERNIPDKVTSLNNLAKSYEMKMRGFQKDTANDTWKITGKAMVGERLIAQSSGIISTYAENVNLMTDKSPEKFMMEFADAFYRVNTMILNDQTVRADNYRAVIKIFKDTLSNVGDIITGSKKWIKDYLIQKSPELDRQGGYD